MSETFQIQSSFRLFLKRGKTIDF
ncbi:hypothetical protein Gotur_011919, partial [Gossypium turneri]